MGNLIDKTGLRFGRLFVLRRIEDYRSPKGAMDSRYRVRCDCGTELNVRSSNLAYGNTNSCGCFKREQVTLAKKTHGDSNAGGIRKMAPEYRAWRGAIERCENPNTERYPHYGGRGIRVCRRWRKSYETFLSDMGRRPSALHSIDRKDNDGNYEPRNCRWATQSEQQRNKQPRKRQ